MKSYATKQVAQLQAGAKSKKTGIPHLYQQIGEEWFIGTFDEISAEIEARAKSAEKTQKRRDKQMITVTFDFLKEDEKYLFVKVGEKTYKVSKNRATGVVDSNSGRIDLTMTTTYFNHRPELMAA